MNNSERGKLSSSKVQAELDKANATLCYLLASANAPKQVRYAIERQANSVYVIIKYVTSANGASEASAVSVTSVLRESLAFAAGINEALNQYM